MESFSVNVLTNRIRRATLHGREYLVAPLSLIVPGVLSGSKGSLYYPADEVHRDPTIWNGVPITLGHPTRNGQPVSARSPEVIEQYEMGRVFNARITRSGRLVGEGWFDVERTGKVDARVLDALRSHTPLELSTGLFTDNHPAQTGASFNGRSYTHVARNYRTDHLAILVDQVGACSLNDGCGAGIRIDNRSSACSVTDGVCVNCGGKGGTPGPCPKSGRHPSKHNPKIDYGNKDDRDSDDAHFDRGIKRAKRGVKRAKRDLDDAKSRHEAEIADLKARAAAATAKVDARTKKKRIDKPKDLLEGHRPGVDSAPGEVKNPRKDTEISKSIEVAKKVTKTVDKVLERAKSSEVKKPLPVAKAIPVARRIGKAIAIARPARRHRRGILGRVKRFLTGNAALPQEDLNYLNRLSEVLNRDPNQPKSSSSGRFKPYGSGTGRGPIHEAAQLAAMVWTDEDEARGREMVGSVSGEGARAFRRPDWATDELRWDKAKGVADGSGYADLDYWTTVAHVYRRTGPPTANCEVCSGVCVNCGGKGGKPGPCPKAGKAAKTVKTKGKKKKKEDTAERDAFETKHPEYKEMRIKGEARIAAEKDRRKKMSPEDRKKEDAGKKVQDKKNKEASALHEVSEIMQKPDRIDPKSSTAKEYEDVFVSSLKSLPHSKVKELAREWGVKAGRSKVTAAKALLARAREIPIELTRPDGSKGPLPEPKKSFFKKLREFDWFGTESPAVLFNAVGDDFPEVLVGATLMAASRKNPRTLDALVLIHSAMSEEQPSNNSDRSPSTAPGDDMNRAAMITFLTANCECWKGKDDAEVLNEFTDAKLKILVDSSKRATENARVAAESTAVVNAVRETSGESEMTVNAMPDFIKKKIGKKKGKKKDDEEDDEEEEVVENRSKPKVETEEEWLKNAPPGITATVNFARRIETKEKSKAVAALTQHVTNAEQKKALAAKLMAKPLDDLLERVAMLPSLATNQVPAEGTDEDPIANYLGAGGTGAPPAKSTLDVDDILQMPVINWSEKTA